MMSLSTTQSLSTPPLQGIKGGSAAPSLKPKLLGLQFLSLNNLSTKISHQPEAHILRELTMGQVCLILPVKDAWRATAQRGHLSKVYVDAITHMKPFHSPSVFQPMLSVSRCWKTSPSSFTLRSIHLETTRSRGVSFNVFPAQYLLKLAPFLST